MLELKQLVQKVSIFYKVGEPVSQWKSWNPMLKPAAALSRGNGGGRSPVLPALLPSSLSNFPLETGKPLC